MSFRQWNDEDTNLLLQHWSGIRDLSYLSILLNRTITSIYLKSSKLRLSYTETPRIREASIRRGIGKSEIIQKKQEFLSVYKDVRKICVALRLIHWQRPTFIRHYKSDPEFHIKCDEITSFISKTKKCHYCKCVEPVDSDLFRKIQSKNKGFAVCKKCSSNTSKKYIRTTLRGRSNRIVAMARNRKLSNFDIDADFICSIFNQQNGKCAYTGINMTFDNDKSSGFSTLMSIDRVDSNLGYERSNVVLCCFSVNMMKSDLSLSDFKRLCSMVLDYAKTI